MIYFVVSIAILGFTVAITYFLTHWPWEKNKDVQKEEVVIMSENKTSKKEKDAIENIVAALSILIEENYQDSPEKTGVLDKINSALFNLKRMEPKK